MNTAQAMAFACQALGAPCGRFAWGDPRHHWHFQEIAKGDCEAMACCQCGLAASLHWYDN